MATQEIFDIDLQGSISNEGEITTYEGVQALQNAIKLFLTSFPADCIRNYGAGGFLTQYLSKPMDENTATMMKMAIRISFDKHFFPQVTITGISAIPNTLKRYWEITIQGYCPTIQDNVEVNFVAKSMV